jgi:hypothetical protein
MPRRRIALSLLLVAVLLPAGCGSDSTAGDSGTSGSGPTAGNGGDTGGDNGGDDGGDNGGDNGGGSLSWVPFGPKDPQSPTPTWSAYNYLADGKCAELAGEVANLTADQGGDFGKAMVALCQAAVKGQSKQWAVVQANQNAETGALNHDCLTPLVKDLMARGLAWRRAHPGAVPRVRFQRVTTGSGETECGRAANQENGEQTTEPTDEPTEQPTEQPTEETPPTENPSESSSPDAAPTPDE